MNSEKDTPTSKPPDNSPEPQPKSRRKFVRFDFPPGAGPEEIAKAIHELTQKHLESSKQDRN